MSSGGRLQLVPIVEGQGEQLGAVGVLLRCLLWRHQTYDLSVAEPIRRPRGEIVKPGGIERWVRRAYDGYRGCRGVLVILDADDDCRNRTTPLGPELVARARGVVHEIPVYVVLANREFESWFLAGVEGLIASGDAEARAAIPANPDVIRDAKGRLARDFLVARRYRPTVDQPRLADRFDLAWAFHRSRSFRKLWKDVASLVDELGGAPVHDPTAEGE